MPALVLTEQDAQIWSEALGLLIRDSKIDNATQTTGEELLQRVSNRQGTLDLSSTDVVTLYASSRYYWHQLDREKGEPGHPNVADCRLQALNRASAKLPPLPNDIPAERSPNWIS